MSKEFTPDDVRRAAEVLEWYWSENGAVSPKKLGASALRLEQHAAWMQLRQEEECKKTAAVEELASFLYEKEYPGRSWTCDAPTTRNSYLRRAEEVIEAGWSRG